MDDGYIYIITALFPLSGLILILQVNPYHALVIRGILGAIAALVYAVLGAADVALTEALVGTMLAITLYAVAVRSSLVMRLGVVKDESNCLDHPDFQQLIRDVCQVIHQYHVRLELVHFPNPQELKQALEDKEIHALCLLSETEKEQQIYHTTLRIPRLYEILQEKLSSTAKLSLVTSGNSGEKH